MITVSIFDGDTYNIEKDEDMFIFTSSELAVRAREIRLRYDRVTRVFLSSDLSRETCMGVAGKCTYGKIKWFERNVISFCLWGNNPMYTCGIIENIKLAKIYLPGWECWVYVHCSVNKDVIDEMKKYDVKVIMKNEEKIRRNRYMLWRLEPLDNDDVTRLIARDSDSRITPKEVLAIYEWVESGKTLHIMRDHPNHYPKILGGMFGLYKKGLCKPKISWKQDCEDFYTENGENTDDQQFLLRFYDSSRMIHDEIKRYEGKECIDYFLPFEQNGEFIGCHTYANGSVNKEEGNILRQWLLLNRPKRISKYGMTMHSTLESIGERINACYVMHYTKLVERKKMLVKNIEKTLLNRFVPVQWIENFDREDLTLPMIQKGYRYDARILSRKMTLPEIANGLAHVHILEKCKENNITLVLEDDTVFKDNFVYNLKHVLDNLPQDWEMICLGGPTEPNTQPAPTLPNATDMTFNTQDIVLYKPSSPGTCTVSCFLINPLGANKLLDSGFLKPLSAPIDDSIWMAGKRIGLKIYWAQPWISYEGSKLDMFNTSLERGF